MPISRLTTSWSIPPFSLKDWRVADELVHDGRWNGYDTLPTGNANYAWILHMVFLVEKLRASTPAVAPCAHFPKFTQFPESPNK